MDDHDRLERIAHTAESWATLALTGLVLAHTVDMVTGGRLRAGVAAAWRRARARTAVAPPVPTPEDVTALLSEASRITRGAADHG